MARKLGFNHSRMHSGGTHSASTVALVKRDGEKNIRGLRAAVGNEWFVRRSLKIGIGQVHVGKPVTCGREDDQPAAFTQKRRNPVDQDKVSEMIGAKLCLKAIRRMAKRSGHHAR